MKQMEQLIVQVTGIQTEGARGRNWQVSGEDCRMRSLITCTLHQMLLG